MRTSATAPDPSREESRGSTMSIPASPGINIDKCYNAGHNWDINGEATITRCYHANILIIDGTTSSVLIA